MLPNSLTIVDYAVGHTGSVYDAQAFHATYIFKKHKRILAPGKWIWADSVYPSKTWCVTPFWKPTGGELSHNQWTYNYHVLKVSSYCISFVFLWSSITRSAYVLSMQSGYSKATFKPSMNSEFKSPCPRTTNGQSLLSSAALLRTTWCLCLRVGTLTHVFMSTSTQLEDNIWHHTMMKVAMVDCRRFGNTWNWKGRGSSSRSWCGFSIVNQAGQWGNPNSRQDVNLYWMYHT